ncbi:hypothetical protein [Rhodohalobacter sp.]|uniref:hypothetical protein n=1 Tax=Rhodohalobacter sp. TaxID=1974210 RepID=UPI0035680AF8
MKEKSTIRVVREEDFFGVSRKLKVLVDDKHVTDLKYNQGININVQPGTYKTQVKMDWCTCRPEKVGLEAGERVEFRVETGFDESIEMPSSNFVATKRFFKSAFDWSYVDYGTKYIAIENALIKVVSAGVEILRDIFSIPGGRRFHFQIQTEMSMPFGLRKEHNPVGSDDLFQNNYSFIFIINSLDLELENEKMRLPVKKWASLQSKMPGAH